MWNDDLVFSTCIDTAVSLPIALILDFVSICVGLGNVHVAFEIPQDLGILYSIVLTGKAENGYFDDVGKRLRYCPEFESENLGGMLSSSC